MRSVPCQRWMALLALPLLVAALLLMHGLDAGGSTMGLHGAPAVEADHSHHGATPAEHHGDGCDGCAVAHAMVACVAIVAGGAALRLARRSLCNATSTTAAPAAGRLLAALQRMRPPGPAWVRLGVMRC